MYKLLILISLFLSCSSEFIAAPGKHPDFQDCTQITKTMTGKSPFTAIKIPFAGTRTATLGTNTPENWEEFNGSVHLVALDWNLEWVNEANLYVGGLGIAEYENDKWNTFEDVDIYPALRVDNNRLKFDAKLYAQGWKPSGEQRIVATVTAYLCGENSYLVKP